MCPVMFFARVVHVQMEANKDGEASDEDNMSKCKRSKGKTGSKSSIYIANHVSFQGKAN